MSDEEENKVEETAPETEENSSKTDNTESSSEGAGDSSASGINLEDMSDLGNNNDAEDENEFQPGEPMAKDVEAIYDIPVQISAVLGRSTMQVSQLLKLGRGAVVELDRKVGEAIDIYVNNRLVARGEVVVVDDKLGVTMTEIVKTDRN